MPWYKSGTVSVALNSNAVIGTGAAFIANSRVGDAFRGPDGGWYEVTNIASDTALSISPNYQGATNAAGTYALAPMQGYVKESADTLRALVNTYGTKLAALGTTGNYDVLPVVKGGTGGTDQASARAGIGLGAVAIESVVPVLKGGTGGATQAAARTGLGLKTAAAADILGTVSQSGGVPTGAIIETGSNANGTYTKYADGTMICGRTLDLSSLSITTPMGALFASAQQTGKSFAAAFSAFPTCLIKAISANANVYVGDFALPVTTASQAFYAIAPVSGSQNVTAVIFAYGRWF